MGVNTTNSTHNHCVHTNYFDGNGYEVTDFAGWGCSRIEFFFFAMVSMEVSIQINSQDGPTSDID